MNAPTQTPPLGKRRFSPFAALARDGGRASRSRPPAAGPEWVHFRVIELVADGHGPGTRVELHREGRSQWVQASVSHASALGAHRGEVIAAKLVQMDPCVPHQTLIEWRHVGDEDTGCIPWLELVHPSWVPDPGQLAALLRLVGTLSPVASRLIHAVFENNGDARSFLRAPASLNDHHAYPGGLLKHTVEVTNFADSLRLGASIDRDLLVAAAILHDIGKAREYAVGSGGRAIRTCEGALLFHKVLGKAMVDRACDRAGIDPVFAARLGHCIVAADGPYYMGLPRKILAEAFLVSAADSASAAQG
jgi:putative nucleotidyltransferase with HDIG domain